MAQQIGGVAPGLARLLEQGGARAQEAVQELRAASLDTDSVFARVQARSKVGATVLRERALGQLPPKALLLQHGCA
jgi:hypothetical protein